MKNFVQNVRGEVVGVIHDQRHRAPFSSLLERELMQRRKHLIRGRSLRLQFQFRRDGLEKAVRGNTGVAQEGAMNLA